MTSPTKNKQPLGERSSNIPPALKSPSKIPLPPSPTKAQADNCHQPTFTDETGPMDAMFNASTLSQKPDFVRKITEAHNAGQTYVSPSDNILSPTTKKLSEVKGKRFGSQKKSSSLYHSQNIFAKAIPESKPDEVTKL